MNIYDDLPADDLEAFLQLEAIFRKEYEDTLESNQNNWRTLRQSYANKTLAAAQALEVVELVQYHNLLQEEEIEYETMQQFLRSVDRLIISVRVKRSRHFKAMSVGFTPEQKSKVHAFISKIREQVETSAALVAKKEKLFAILANLTREIDQPRTGFERFTDLARALAGLSKEVENEGAQPWWPWFNRIMGILDGAKETELQLPKPLEVKKLEPPKSQNPKADLDDIPF